MPGSRKSADRLRPAVGPPERAPARLSSPTLLGRYDELRQLRAAVHQPPTVILVEGEAGIGKSRLIKEWLAEPDLVDTATLIGTCSPLRDPFPFGPVIDALASAARWLPNPRELSPVIGALRPLLPELAQRLPPALPPLDSRQQERHRIFRGIRELLASLGPAVLVLEDLHWIDDSTRELIRFLADRPPSQLTLVLTYRREDLADPSSPALAPPAAAGPLRLTLRPLAATEIAELIGAVCPTRATDEFVRYLHERTMGIPLMLEETLGLLRDRPPVGNDPAALPATLDIPTTLRDALLERVSRLSRSARRLLHAAAVLGKPVTEPVLAVVAGLSSRHCPAGLAELVERALMRPAGEGRYGFRHGLAQQAVHDSLPEPTRRALHRRAVTALTEAAGSPPLGQLAYHCRAAGLVAQWQHYAEAAADQAIALGDDETASQLLREVAARADTTEVRVRIAIKMGRAALTGLKPGAAIEMLEQALADPQLPTPTRGELRLCLGILLRNQVRRSRAGWAALARAVEELAEHPAQAARAMASLGAPHLTDGHHLDEHLAWLTRATTAAEQVGDPELTAVVVANRATALISTGDPAGWQLTGLVQSHPHDPTPTRQLANNPLLTVNGAWSALWVGRYTEAGVLLRAAERLVTSGCGSYPARALSGTALMYDYAVGNWDGLADRAHRVATSMSDVPSVAAEARLVLGRLAMATGELREAQAHLAEATGAVPVAVTAAGALARLAAATGDTTAADQLVTDAWQLIRSKGVWCWAAELLPVAVGVLVRSPYQQPAARKLLDEVTTGLTNRDAPLAAAALTAGRAMLAEADGAPLAAAAQYAEAAWAYGVLPHPYAAAQAWEARGRCLVAAGRDGTGALTEAVAMFERLGASWDVASCRHLLRNLGSVLPHRRGRRGYGGQLSPREREVVRLVRSGLTNREVAETLFLSPRTVEAHVARALRKLGLPSRRVLAATGRDEV